MQQPLGIGKCVISGDHKHESSVKWFLAPLCHSVSEWVTNAKKKTHKFPQHFNRITVAKVRFVCKQWKKNCYHQWMFSIHTVFHSLFRTWKDHCFCKSRLFFHLNGNIKVVSNSQPANQPTINNYILIIYSVYWFPLEM